MALAPVYTQKDGVTTLPIRFDPAESLFVIFRKPADKAGHLVSAIRAGKSAAVALDVRIVKATYGAPDDAAHTADVTEAVAAMAQHGQVSIAANNDNFGDPALNLVKQLTVEWVVNVKPHKATVREGDEIDLVEGGRATMPEFEVTAGKQGTELKAWKSGDYTVKTADGKQLRLQVKAGAATREIAGPWTLGFPDGWGAPKQVTLDKLISWSEHSNPGVKYFSGTAKYVKDFDLPANMVGKDRAVVLDLGRVKNFAQIPDADYLEGITLRSLAVICADMLAKREVFLLEAEHIASMPISLELHVRHIAHVLAERGRHYFSRLLGEDADAEEIVVTLLAILELYKRGEIDFRQDELFGDIEILQLTEGT
jgi:hypothetical protein